MASLTSNRPTQIRNLPPEWEALFKGLNDTLKSLGAHGITKKEAQMLFAMASDALSAPGSTTARTPAAPSTAPASALAASPPRWALVSSTLRRGVVAAP